MQPTETDISNLDRMAISWTHQMDSKWKITQISRWEWRRNLLLHSICHIQCRDNPLFRFWSTDRIVPQIPIIYRVQRVLSALAMLLETLVRVIINMPDGKVWPIGWSHIYVYRSARISPLHLWEIYVRFIAFCRVALFCVHASQMLFWMEIADAALKSETKCR